jgi:hypothetical protein
MGLGHDDARVVGQPGGCLGLKTEGELVDIARVNEDAVSEDVSSDKTVDLLALRGASIARASTITLLGNKSLTTYW